MHEFFWLALALFILNALYLIHSKYIIPKKNFHAYWNLYIQIVIDLILVSVCTYLTGGIETPFIFTFLFHVTLVCIFLNKIQSFFFTTISVLLTETFIVLEFFQAIPQKSLILTDFKIKIYQDADYIIFYIVSIFFISYAIWYLVSTLSDRLKKREAMLAEYNDKLVAVSKERSKFILIAGHEFKAPLAAIQSYAHILLKEYHGKLPEPIAKVVTRIYERCNKLNIQVKEMIQLANITSMAAQDIVKTPCNMKEIAEKIIASLKTIASEKQVSLHFSLEPAFVYGNEEQLEIMLSNLINNAIVYSKEQGEVKVTLKKDGQDVELKVQDRGIGIAPENLEKIFEEHFCAKNAVLHNKYATGLGLAIVKNVLKNHDGNITVESELDKGSTFTLYFKELRNEKNIDH